MPPNIQLLFERLIGLAGKVNELVDSVNQLQAAASGSPDTGLTEEFKRLAAQVDQLGTAVGKLSAEPKPDSKLAKQLAELSVRVDQLAAAPKVAVTQF